MRHVRLHRRLANLDGMSVPRITGRVMANDAFLRREFIQLVHYSDAPDLALTLLVHAYLIARHAGFLEIARHHEIFRPREGLPIYQ